MNALLRDLLSVVLNPDAFFERIQGDRSWRRATIHFLVLSTWISVWSVVAREAGVTGDTPVNSSCDAQMSTQAYWRDSLRPTFGIASLPLRMGIMVLYKVAVAAF